MRAVKTGFAAMEIFFRPLKKEQFHISEQRELCNCDICYMNSAFAKVLLT